MTYKKMQFITLTLIGVILLTGCASSRKSESTGQYIDSSLVTTEVKARLIADKHINSLPITVKTYKNTVQLSGFVNTREQKLRAEKIAYSVQGVEAVQDDLIIK